MNEAFPVPIAPGQGVQLPAVSGADQGARLITLLREQLGLALRSVPGARDVLVIDHAEHPAPN
jgi:uncharacterized protein (TIGR03435 family)